MGGETGGARGAEVRPSERDRLLRERRRLPEDPGDQGAGGQSLHGGKGGIRVHATLLDNTDAVLAQQAVYAGNVLSGEAIRKGNRDTLSKALGNRFGEGLANMNVAPGKAIPFMVVFFDAPATMDSYKLEAKDGE